jgi:hypothetical protein
VPTVEGVRSSLPQKLPTNPSRTIVPLMVFATVIALVGHSQEVATQEVATQKTPKLNPAVGDAQILLGGTIAAVILTLIAEAGNVGAKFGKGLALLALLSSIALYGGGVATGLNKITGQVTPQGAKAATPTKPTTSAKPTTSTKGTA